MRTTRTRRRSPPPATQDVVVVEEGTGDTVVVVAPVRAAGMVLGTVVVESGLVVGDVDVGVGVGVVVDVVVEAVEEVLGEVDVVDCGVSGDTQLAGGEAGPVCPGMRTVPAHPKLLNIASTVTEPPSENP